MDFCLTCIISADGDSEVDVNDIEYALQKVILARKAEDTWDVDRFDSIPAKARAPDEVCKFFFMLPVKY